VYTTAYFHIIVTAERIYYISRFVIKQKIIKINRRGQLGTTLLYIIGAVWITILYIKSVKFESNDRYHYIRKTILNAR